MKRLHLYYSLPLLLLLSGCHTSRGEGLRTSPTPPPVPQEAKVLPLPATSRYFATMLAGQSATPPRQRLDLGELAEVRQQVWRLWAEANQGLAETGLPTLAPFPAYTRPLPEVTAHRWTLSGERYGQSTYPAVMPFYYGAKGTKPTAGYPLYLYLHGSGPKAGEWQAGLALALTFQDSPSAYFIPQIPNGEGVADGQLYRWWQTSKLEAWEKLLRLSLLSADLDPRRFYFFGISEGGYGSQRLASYYADYLAGAGPMAGGEPLINAPVENLQHVAFTLRTGSDDTGFHRNELTDKTGTELDRLATAYPGNYKHWVARVPGYGHAIPYGDTTPWLAQHTRQVQPKKVNWEDFPMDGRYRRGFYNLVPLQRAGKTGRLYYEEDIRDNVVDLKVSEVTYHEERISDLYRDFRLVLTYTRSYAPASGGRVRVYLSPELVDLSQPVQIRVNGRVVFSGLVALDWEHVATSCELFFDPLRLYPAAVEVAY